MDWIKLVLKTVEGHGLWWSMKGSSDMGLHKLVMLVHPAFPLSAREMNAALKKEGWNKLNRIPSDSFEALPVFTHDQHVYVAEEGGGDSGAGLPPET